MPIVYTINGIDPNLEHNLLQRAIRKLCKKLNVSIYLNGLIYNSYTNSNDATLYFGYKKGAEVIIEELFKDPIQVDGKCYKFNITLKKEDTFDDTISKSHIYRNQGGNKNSMTFNPSKEQRSESSRNLEPNKYARDRSRSPLTVTDEDSALNMELKLLEKQKQVIEQQRRVLLEKRKIDSKTASEPQQKNYGQHSQNLYINAPNIPKFMEPKKILESNMNEIITRIIPVRRRHLFHKLFHPLLRMNIALAIENNGRDIFDPTFTTDEIVSLYRSRHPCESDEAFVAKVWRQVKNAYWPLKTTNKNEKPKQLYIDDDDNVDIQREKAGNTDKNVVAETADISQPEVVHDESIDVVEQADVNNKLDDTIEENWVDGGGTDWN